MERRRWLRLLIVATALVAVHGMIFYFVSSHLGVAVAIIGFGVLVLLKHLGSLGRVHARFRWCS